MSHFYIEDDKWSYRVLLMSITLPAPMDPLPMVKASISLLVAILLKTKA